MTKKKSEQENINIENNTDTQSIDIELTENIEESPDMELVEDKYEEDYETDLDFDFWEDVLTSYGEINSKEELNLILKKLNLDLQREKQKISKIKSIILNRNSMQKQKAIAKAKAEKKALRALSPEKQIAFKQNKLNQKLEEKQTAADSKQEELDKKLADKQEKLDKKEMDAIYKQQEKIALLSMTPSEKREYLFQKNAKNKIESLNKKIEDSKNAQAEASKSKALPIKGFIFFTLGCAVVAGVLAFCGTNIYIDTQYYNEKIDVLSKGISEYDVKLDGDMVVGVSNIQSGLGVYDQILANGPIMEEQLNKLNNTYKWVLKPATVESLGINEITKKASDLESDLTKIKSAMSNGNGFVENVNRIYNSDKALPDMIEALNGYSTSAEKSISEFTALSFPNGLEEHKDAYIENISLSNDYYMLIMEYLNELTVIKEDVSDVIEAIEDAQEYKPRSSYSLNKKIDGFYKNLDEAVDMDKKLSTLNNNVSYASIIKKKNLAFLVNPEISSENVDFYNMILELRSICNMSDKLERKCMDLPYPTREQTDDPELIKFMTQNYSEIAITDNQALLDRLNLITPPEAISTSVRSYKTGLEVRGEYLLLQKKYMDLEEEKNGYFLDIITAEAEHDNAYKLTREHRSTNGKDEEYERLDAEEERLEDVVDEKEDIAKAKAKELRDTMKDIRKEAQSKQDDYKDYMDYD